MNQQNQIKSIVSNSTCREEFWVNFINHHKLKNVCEVGVSEGVFAKELLKSCPSIKKYIMVDPWKHLEDWNKPSNRNNESFKTAYQTTLKNTNFAKKKRVVLKDKTTEVLNKISDSSLDFAYIDGDHTLRGITIDLVGMYPKIKTGGYVGGDDLHSNIWIHPTKFEPTLVFPYVIHFAEAVGATIYLLPYNQFLLSKQPNGTFKVVDFTSNYTDTSLKSQYSFSKYPFKANTKRLLGRFYKGLFNN